MTRRRNTKRITGSEADNTLVIAYRTGDKSAKEMLTDRIMSVAYRFLISKTQSQYLARELLQTVFMELDKALLNLGEPIDIKLNAFCRTIAFRVLMNHFRRFFVEAKLRAEPIVAGINEPADTNMNDRLWYDELEHLQAAIANLSERHRDIIQMRFYDSKSVAKMAIAFGVSQGRIRQLIDKALEKLRIQLSRNNLPELCPPVNTPRPNRICGNW